MSIINIYREKEEKERKNILIPPPNLPPILNLPLPYLPIQNSRFILFHISRRYLFLVHLHHRTRGILGIGILGKMDGNGTVIGGLTDEKTDILHFEHGAGAVREGFVEVVGAGEGVDGDGRGGGHFSFFFFGGVVVGR